MKYLFTCILMLFPSAGYGNDLIEKLQNCSVTIRAEDSRGGGSQGSGVLITRDVQISKDNETTIKTTFCWTCAHVLSDLRSVREIIDSSGNTRKVIEFSPPQIVRELIQNGEKIGEVKLACRVIKYSDSETGDDLALLQVLKKDFIEDSIEFYLEEENIDIGTRLYSVSSMMGQIGSNSVTDGLLSYIGRVLPLGNKGFTVFDQTSVIARSGSSGSGVYLTAESEEKAGLCLGLVARGSGDGFNLIIPARRMKRFCQDNNLMWAIDKSAKTPTLAELKNIKIEDFGSSLDLGKAFGNPTNTKYKFLIENTETSKID